MRLILLFAISAIATFAQPAGSQPPAGNPTCEVGLAGETGKAASREQVFTKARQVRDCLRQQKATEKQPRQPHAFWVGLLGFFILICCGAILVLTHRPLDNAARQAWFLSMAAIAVAVSAALAVGFRFFDWNASDADSHLSERRAKNADWRWQMDIARAGQIENEADAIDKALDATERLIENQPDRLEP